MGTHGLVLKCIFRQGQLMREEKDCTSRAGKVCEMVNFPMWEEAEITLRSSPQVYHHQKGWGQKVNDEKYNKIKKTEISKDLRKKNTQLKTLNQPCWSSVFASSES